MESVSGFMPGDDESDQLITTQQLWENIVFIIKPSQNPILNKDGHPQDAKSLIAVVSKVREVPTISAC